MLDVVEQVLYHYDIVFVLLLGNLVQCFDNVKEWVFEKKDWDIVDCFGMKKSLQVSHHISWANRLGLPLPNLVLDPKYERVE